MAAGPETGHGFPSAVLRVPPPCPACLPQASEFGSLALRDRSAGPLPAAGPPWMVLTSIFQPSEHGPGRQGSRAAVPFPSAMFSSFSLPSAESREGVCLQPHTPWAQASSLLPSNRAPGSGGEMYRPSFWPGDPNVACRASGQPPAK